MSTPSDHCTCTCGKPGCISAPGRPINRSGITIHNLEGYKSGCRCDVCNEAGLAKKRERFARRNGKSKQTATSHYRPWTSDELKVIARPDLTDFEAGQIIGRTMTAVRRARYRYGVNREGAE